MSATILVAFATRHGSTAGIADALGEALRDATGLPAEVRRAAEVDDIEPYQAVVVGSAVYMGKWQSDAIDFLKRFERELRERPVWFFSSGPTGGTPDGDAAVVRATESPGSGPVPGDVAKRGQRIGIAGHATFAGRVGEEANGLLERWMPRGDWRDFDAIAAWARRVASEIAPDPAS